MRAIQWLIADDQIEYFNVGPGSMIMAPFHIPVVQLFVEVVHLLYEEDSLEELYCAHGAIYYYFKLLSANNNNRVSVLEFQSVLLL